MTDITVNPPAFPTTEDNGCNSGTPGMTLLDYMAAKAMQSLVSTGSTIPSEIAQSSYRAANAMLKERTKWIK